MAVLSLSAGYVGDYRSILVGSYVHVMSRCRPERPKYIAASFVYFAFASLRHGHAFQHTVYVRSAA